MTNVRLLILNIMIAVVGLNTVAFAQTFPIEIQYYDGRIIAHLQDGGINRKFYLETLLPMTGTERKAEKQVVEKTRITTIKNIHYFNHECKVTNIVTMMPYGLNWDIEIIGLNDAWSVPIETRLKWDTTASLVFWTTWPDNQLNSNPTKWEDPFVTAPFRNLELVYGGQSHLTRNSFVAPIASSFFPENDIGISFIQSLTDTIMDLSMRTSETGTISYIQTNRRISNKNVIRISHRIIRHQSDWRSGMKWLSENYPSFFFPKEPLVNQIAGCGAYSAYEGDFDAEKYRKMAFSFNWKASFDFPYMGMFIPPVKSDTEKWTKFSLTGEGELTSIQRMRDYSEKFKRNGFYTLSYFNVTEFGNNIVYPYRNPSVKEEDAWKNANDFVYGKLKTAILRPPKLMPEWDDRPIFSNWVDCIVMDPGDPVYQQFLLNQAELHIKKIPASAGICIDRLDWLRYYNGAADDGISLVQGNKVRSLIMSWNDIIEKIGSIMHDNKKIILCNPLYRRIDLMKQIDGFYDEFGHFPVSLNLTAQMAMFKPLVAWTERKENFQPDPDSYFQHHLYLGAFLTAPFPGNDHTINPDPEIEKYYLDYGPLLGSIKGREWILSPHAIEVKDSQAKANLFKVKEKIMIPVIHAGAAKHVRLVLRLPSDLVKKEKLSVKALFPGSNDWKKIDEKKYADVLEITVPVQRGCALISLE